MIGMIDAKRALERARARGIRTSSRFDRSLIEDVSDIPWSVVNGAIF